MGSAGASPRPLLNWGARVFGCDLSAAELAETAKAGVNIEVLDLTDRAAAEWIAWIERTTGGAIDVLVNNAGGVAGQEMRPIEVVTDADWDRIFAVNIGAAFTLSRAVAAGMKRAGSGRIINISSRAGLGPSPNDTLCARKGSAVESVIVDEGHLNQGFSWRISHMLYLDGHNGHGSKTNV